LLDLRIVTAAASLVAIASCMYLARRLRNDLAMIMTGLLLAVDFALLRESRTFSLDGLSSTFLATSLLPFSIYLKAGGRTMLVVSGALIGLSTATKLLGGLGLIGMLFFLLVQARADKSFKRRIVDMAILLTTAAIPLAIFLVALGPHQMLTGMILDQGERGFVPELKLSILGYFALNAAYLLPMAYARRVWSLGPEAKFLLITSGIILVFMILQPLTFFHHLVLLSPPLAILGGICLSDLVFRKKVADGPLEIHIIPRRSFAIFAAIGTVAIAGIVVSAGFAAYGLARQGEPFQEHFASVVEQHSSQSDWVVSGDPLIAAMADRMTPPGLVNVAFRIHPDITQESVESAIIAYNVKVVVVCYRLNEMVGLPTFLLAHGYDQIEDDFRVVEPVMNLFEDPVGPVTVFVRSD